MYSHQVHPPDPPPQYPVFIHNDEIGFRFRALLGLSCSIATRLIKNETND